jgi:hypothetical protein
MEIARLTAIYRKSDCVPLENELVRLRAQIAALEERNADLEDAKRTFLGLHTAPLVVRDVHGIYAPWDSAPVSVDGVWLGGWYVACGGGGSKSPVMGPTELAK